MSKENDLYGRFDDMVDAVLAPPPAEKKRDRKPVRPQLERDRQRTEERRGNNKNSRRK